MFANICTCNIPHHTVQSQKCPVCLYKEIHPECHYFTLWNSFAYHWTSLPPPLIWNSFSIAKAISQFKSVNKIERVLIPLKSRKKINNRKHNSNVMRNVFFSTCSLNLCIHKVKELRDPWNSPEPQSTELQAES